MKNKDPQLRKLLGSSTMFLVRAVRLSYPYLGLKPQAESYYPFGISPTRSRRVNKVCDREESWELGVYLIAPMVNPRTNCLETMMLNMITGRAIMVPVAMICPQGRS